MHLPPRVKAHQSCLPPLSASSSSPKDSDSRFALQVSSSSRIIHISPSRSLQPLQHIETTSSIMDKPENGNINVIESHSVENGGFELRNYSQLGGTENDERDMQMLGRTQQLNVRRSPPSFRVLVLLTIIAAQFSIHFNSRFCLHVDVHLGNCSHVCSSLLYA